MSELPIPAELMPRHVAVIMDGNGRWAKKGNAQSLRAPRRR